MRDARAGQALSRPLRCPLQATGSVLLRLSGRRGDLWLCAHRAELLSAGVPPHGLVPAAGVRSKGGRRGNGGLFHRAVYLYSLLHSFCCLHSREESRRTYLLVALPKDSNPQPFAPLGSALAPRTPRVLPPLSAPLPLTPAPPGSLRSGSVAGGGGVAARRVAAAASRSCEPPSDQPQEACLPPHERRRCLCGGGLVPAVHAPPPLSMRDLTR